MTREEKAKAYEEALEKAREIKEKIIYSHLSTESCKAVSEYIDTIIPELAESEEEKIRKALIEVFKKKLERGFEWVEYGIPNRSVLDWLEKQKECVSNNFDDVWNEEDCEEVIAEGQKLTPRFKELLKEVCHAWYDKGAKLEKQKEQKPLHWRRIEDATTQRTEDGCCVTSEKMLMKGWINDEDYRIVDKGTMVNRDILCIPVRELNAKQKEQNSVDEQFPPIDGLDAIKAKYYDDGFKNGFDEGVASVKPSEWSEEDKQNLSVCLTYIKDTQLRDWLIEAFHRSSKWSAEDKSFYDSIMCEVIKEGMHLTPEQAKWFKSLPERFNLQPKQELSEEETKDLVHILKVLDDCYVYGQHDLSKTDYDNLTRTINSLKPSWKPSEHQMSILKAVKEYVGKGSGYWGEGLGSLIDDLEKL